MKSKQACLIHTLAQHQLLHHTLYTADDREGRNHKGPLRIRCGREVQGTFTRSRVAVRRRPIL
jgi:hypothetical protein